MAQLKTGDLVAGRYRVERLLGVGGMGTVFAARDGDGPRMVAIKVLNEVLRRHPTIPKRFLQEAKAASLLTTPHAVKVEATGDLSDGTPFIVMEFLEGTDLAAIARQAGGRLAVERALYLADQIAAALQDAHARGVLHRDLKPENVFVVPTRSGEVVKVVDFGISKILAPGESVKITVTGTTVGTPQYMPMEQLRGAKDLDGRVDVYALGVLLYEMLAGLRPYDGFSYEQVIMKVATTTAPPLSNYRQDLPPGLSEFVARAMARDRNQRIPSMEQLRLEMQPFWSGRRPELIRSEPPQPAMVRSEPPQHVMVRSEPPQHAPMSGPVSGPISGPISPAMPIAPPLSAPVSSPRGVGPVASSPYGRTPALPPTMDGPALSGGQLSLASSHAALPLVQIHGRPRKTGINPVILIVIALGVAALVAAVAGALGTWWYVHEVEGAVPSASTLPNIPMPRRK